MDAGQRTLHTILEQSAEHLPVGFKRVMKVHHGIQEILGRLLSNQPVQVQAGLLQSRHHIHPKYASQEDNLLLQDLPASILEHVTKPIYAIQHTISLTLKIGIVKCR